MANRETEVWAIDFDNTISPNRDGDPLVLPPYPGVKEVLDQAHEDGIRIAIFTARAWSGFPYQDRRRRLQEVETYLNKHQIPYDEITAEKRPDMTVFVDDKAYRCEAEKDPRWWQKFDKIPK